MPDRWCYSFSDWALLAEALSAGAEEYTDLCGVDKDPSGLLVSVMGKGVLDRGSPQREAARVPADLHRALIGRRPTGAVYQL